MFELYNKTVFIFFLRILQIGDIVMQSLYLEIFGLRNVVVVAAESEVVGMMSGGEIVRIVSF